MKTCRICNQTKPADAYRGTRSACRECGCVYGAEWSRALRLADDAAESVICTEGHNTEGRQWVLYPEQIAADPYLEDCIAHLEWRGIAKAVREDGRVTVIFEEQT